MAEATPADLRFLEEAVARGVLDEAQAADCRRILDTLAEVDLRLDAAEVCIRKDLLTKERADEIKRALARRRVGRYEVLDRLGRGGTGVVWRARDVRLGRLVALKLLTRPGRPDDLVTSYQARFRREARTAVTLNHVNIVRGLDYGETDGYVYFAMELVPGESAAERLQREGRLSEADALRLALQVVDALVYVREFGLVHRDLKPENLLLTPAGEVKVCDLGLAKPTLEEASRLGGDGSIAGTPLYMAPEQVRDPDAVDWRSDVYGLGATLYHLLTGRPPFLPGPRRSVIQSHLEEPPDDPREHVLELSAGTSAIVLKMLAKEPAARYARLEDLASDLGAVLDGRPPSFALRLRSGQEGAVAGVLAETQGARVRRDAPRRRRAGLAAAAAAALGALGLAWAWRPAPVELPALVEIAGTGPAEVPAAPSAVPAGPVAPPTDPGRDALVAARRMDRAREPLHVLVERFAWVADEYAGHPSGEVAATRLAELRVELESRAAAELTSRRQAAEAALARGAVVEASEELHAFPVAYQRTDAYRVALDEAARIVRDGRAAAERRLEEARLAAVEWRFEEAQGLIESVRRTGLEGLPVSRVELELDFERHGRDAEREARRDRWRLAAGRSLMTSLEDPLAADRILEAEVESGALRTWRREADALRTWLPLAHRARVRLGDTWSRWGREGRRVEIEAAPGAGRTLVGTPAGERDGRLLLATRGEGAAELIPADLPLDLLAEAIAPGSERAASGVDEIAAFLMATRRLADAATFQAPPDLVEVVRASAIAEATARLDRATVLVAEGDPVSGRAALVATIDYAPWHGPVHTALGDFLAELGDLDGAVRVYRQALEAGTPDPVARLGLAAVLERRARFADAEGHLRLFLEETHDAGGDTLPALRERAEQDLARVAERRVQAVLETLRRDARNALRAGRKGEAAALFQRVLAARADDAEALLESGRLHRDAGRIFDAFRAWSRLVAAHPGDRRAAEAEREITDLDRFRSGVTAGRQALRDGRAALSEARTDTAIEHLRLAIRLSPFLIDAHLELAGALLARGEEADVREDLTAAVSAADDVLLLDPRLAEGFLVRSRAYFLLGDLEAALADAETAAGRLPGGRAEEAYLLAGRSLLGLDRLDEAVTRLQDAYESRPHADPLYWQAEALRRQGRLRAGFLKLEELYDRFGAPEHLKVRCAQLYNELR